MRNKKLLLENLRKIPIVQIACKKSGVSRATYYRWLEKDEGFRNESQQALYEGTLMVNDLAESKVIESIQSGDMRASMYWLNNHHKSYSYNKIILTPNDRNLIAEKIEDDQLAQVLKLLAEKTVLGEVPSSGSRSLVNTLSDVDKNKQDIESRKRARDMTDALFGTLMSRK